MQYFKYKLKINNSERAILSEWIGTNRCLYNLALSQRQMIDYREVKARSDQPINYAYQAAELKALKAEYHWFGNPPGQTLQQTLMQLDQAFKRFWKGLASFPQFKKKSQDMGIKIPKGKTKKIPSETSTFLTIQTPTRDISSYQK
ncbi:MAG: helix-turn-helix domain-containing protein [Oligoflexus sp.]